MVFPLSWGRFMSSICRRLEVLLAWKWIGVAILKIVVIFSVDRLVYCSFD